MCSPTRASLLTGRNHHRIGNGQIAELANDWDGYAGEIPKSSALGRRGAEALRLRHRRRGASGTTRPADGDDRRRARSTTGRPGSASSTSTGSWPARRRSTSRTWCATPPACCRRRRRRRATTSARTSPTTRSAGCTAPGVRARQAVLHVLGERLPARPAPRDEGVGRQVRRASSTTAGTPTASGCSHARQGDGLDPAGRAS